jgi:hypothetical protein
MRSAYTLAAPNGIGPAIGTRPATETGRIDSPQPPFCARLIAQGRDCGGVFMGEHDRREEAPAPGNWRVTAQPYSKAAVPAGSAGPAGSAAGPVSPAVAPPAAAPGRTGGRPLLATAICAGMLLLWLAGRTTIPTGSRDLAYFSGVAIAGGLFGAILWGIAFAVTIRKASKGWKAGSLILLAMIGAFVALTKLGAFGGAAPSPPIPVVREGK